MVKKIVQGTAVILAGLVAITYALGYNYLFKAVGKTYLLGETGATINDGENFPSNIIAKGTARPWIKDSLYNKTALTNALGQNLKASNTASFLVIKEGKIIHESYAVGVNQNTKSNSFSIAKGITVMLLGKALEENKIRSLNQKFSDFFPTYNTVEFGKDLTIGDLAKMETGLNWTEDYKNPFGQNAKAYYGNSLEEAVLLRGFKDQPSSKFEYQSGATQMLGFSLRKSLQRTLAEYASEKLWKPLGMEQNADWSTDEFGMEKSFCCVHSNARDFAKLGQLFLDEGKVDDLQIINPNHLKQMQTPTKLSKEAYGMGLWINQDAPIKHYYFWGLHGQYIIIIPEKQTVIVRTGMFKDQPKDAKGRPAQVEFLVNQTVENFN
ncbi:serine hydrolase domain-containing protein [Chryseobacterium sp. MP_3.2]|uniref:serine hydrolase domain-containing protein n=1 Tax=Chryseobacterium sp. MP_3.2 TaxID=3071712 RepID=UPI002E09E579|nr:CubicO group peptidase (beta-lactamase class C family) [Chryseobacterium sp. MP_3.2]